MSRSDRNNSLRTLASLPSTEALLVVFINTTPRPVDIIWLDFHGSLIKYCELKSGAGFKVDTFTNHYWKCFETSTGAPLFLNGKSYYRQKSPRRPFQNAQPMAPRQYSQRIPIRISTTMRSLRLLCLLEITRTLRSELDIDNLDIPEELKVNLTHLARLRREYTVATRREGVRNQQLMWYY